MTEWLRLRHTSDVVTSNVDKLKLDNETPVRLINYTDVYYRDRLTPDLPLMWATASASEIARHQVAAGDVLITKDSETADDIGVAAYVETASDDLLCGYHLSRIRAHKSRIDPRYLFWALTGSHARDQMSVAATGVTRFGLRADSIRDLIIRVPSMAEQRAIADYLDTETSRIDALITKKRRMIELFRQRWRSMVEYRMRSLMNTHGTIALKRVVVCLDGRRVPLSAEERSSRRGPYPYYGASGVIDSVDSYLFDETLVLLGEDGAQLADPDYDVSFVVRGKAWVNNHAHVLRPVAADPDFLAMHLTTLDRGAFISGATREKITQADMNEIPVPKVSVSLQSGVARDLSSVRTRCEKAISAITRQLDLLTERRQALITSAVTGEFAVPVDRS